MTKDVSFEKPFLFTSISCFFKHLIVSDQLCFQRIKEEWNTADHWGAYSCSDQECGATWPWAGVEVGRVGGTGRQPSNYSHCSPEIWTWDHWPEVALISVLRPCKGEALNSFYLLLKKKKSLLEILWVYSGASYLVDWRIHSSTEGPVGEQEVLGFLLFDEGAKEISHALQGLPDISKHLASPGRHWTVQLSGLPRDCPAVLGSQGSSSPRCYHHCGHCTSAPPPTHKSLQGLTTLLHGRPNRGDPGWLL